MRGATGDGCSPAENIQSGGDEIEDFLSKGNHKPAGKSQEALRPLGGIVALKGKTDLHDAPAQKDQTNRADQGKDKVGQIVDYAKRVAGSEGGNRKAAEAQHHGCIGGKAEPPLPVKRRSVGGPNVLPGVFLQHKKVQGFLQKHSSSLHFD